MKSKNRIAGVSPRRLWLRFAAVLLVLVMSIGFLSGCKPDEDEEKGTTVVPGFTESSATSADLYCREILTYSGAFVEDGTNEEVTAVAAIVVENCSNEFLDQATVTYNLGDKTATFVVTGLPAGGVATVLEASRLTLDGSEKFVSPECTSAFKRDAITSTEDVTVTAKDNVLTATNNTDKTLKNVCIYYKNMSSDGTYLGGITYMIVFGDMQPGEKVEKTAAHYFAKSRIVRYSYQTE